MGKVVALSRFISRVSDIATPVLNTLKKGRNFAWTLECEEAFLRLKAMLATPPIYLGQARARPAITPEREKEQCPVYFISKTLQGPERRYQKIEKGALALVIASRRLRPYFQSFSIIVRTDMPIQQVLRKPDLAGRMVAWSVQLSEFDISFEKRAKMMAASFESFRLLHVPRDQNERADLLAKLASTRRGLQKSVIHENINTPTIEKPEVQCNEQRITWMDPVVEYLEEGRLPVDPVEASRIRKEAPKYTLVEQRLYMRGFSSPVLKCVDPEEAEYSFTSVEHPQANGQAEATNRVILRGLRRRLEEAKGRWAEELPQVLWSYHTTPHSTTGETPFRLTYGSKAVIPVEIGEPSPTTTLFDPTANEEELRTNLDLLQETREIAHIKEYAVKARAARKYDRRMIHRDFQEGDLVLRKITLTVEKNKLTPKWE
ncbi:Retrovirus-related Pol polyprotein from transposon 17.6, partial [Mucuna pruriens]